jgi:hypothetical protein
MKSMKHILRCMALPAQRAPNNITAHCRASQSVGTTEIGCAALLEVGESCVGFPTQSGHAIVIVLN